MEKDFDIAKINETIVEMIEDHILVCDIEGQIVFSNKAMQTHLGYSGLELKQKKLMAVISDIHKNKVGAFLKNASETPSDKDEFLLNGKHDQIRLHLVFLKKNNLYYLYGNEKNAECERLLKKMDLEIANAVKIHKRSLPASLPDTERISFSSLYIPAEILGGDLFDAFQVDNGLLDDYFEQYVCFVADVSGHGLDSAMLAIFVKDTIRSYFRLKHIPGQVLSPKEIVEFFIDQYRKEGYPEEYLVCLFMAVFDLKTNELTYCNAGFHICPLLIKADGTMTELHTAGMPISTALDEKWLRYEDSYLQLFPSMTLFIMSDGLPEQRVANEFYEERLKKLLPEIHSLRPAEAVHQIHLDFIDFLNHERIKDDITVVAAKLL